MHYFTSHKLRIVILLGLLLSCLAAHAQNAVPFTARKNMNVRGDITMIGNNIVNRDSGGSDPEDPYSGNTANDDYNMRYIDVDGDNSTFSSSKATLTVPSISCSKIVYAALYWSATYKYENTSGSNSRSVFNQVKLKRPGDTGYTTVTGTTIFDGFGTSFNSNSPYVCYADITANLQSLTNPNGEYTVADIRATQGTFSGGISGGWNLFVIYENPTLPGKYITSFDGFVGVNSGLGNVEINYSGFTTVPSPLTVKAKLAAAALEGDKQINGDRLQFKSGANPYQDLGNSLNPTNNFFNGSITTLDATDNPVAFTNRVPNSSNTLGYDADIISIPSGFLPNSATSASLNLKSTQDTYYMFFNAIAVDIIEPDIELVKTVENVAGQNIAGQDVHLSDVLDYVIQFDNIGNDHAQNFTITDQLPVNTSFQDIDLDDVPGASYVPGPAPGQITISIPNNLVLKGTQSRMHEIRIRVQVASSCNDLTDACANVIENTAYATYQGVENTAVISNNPSVAGIGTCGEPSAGPANFLVDVANCTYSRTEVLCGPTLVLTAGDNYASYAWYMENGATDIFLDSTQSITVNTPGQYYVINTPVPPCIGLTETITVNLSSDLPPNPLLPFADDVAPAICPNNGIVMTNIFLCGINAQKIISTGVVAGTATWYKLNTAACNTVLPANCPHNGCPEASWTSIATGPNYTATTAGEYRLVINSNGCSATYYFNVYKNNLDPQVEVQNIVCTTPGQIKVVNVPAGYEYTLINQTTNTTLVPYGPTSIFPIATLGVYTVKLRQVGVPNGCEFVLPNIGVMNKTMTANVTKTDKTCTVPGSINIQVSGVDPQYTFKITGPGGVVITHGPVIDSNHNFTGLNPGAYTVEVTSQDGCTLPPVAITVNDFSAPALNAAVTLSPSCDPGQITLTPSGGLAPYSFAVYSINGVNQNPTAASYFLDATYDVPVANVGTYVFITKDANGCTQTSNQVIITNIVPVVTTGSLNVKCNGDTNGSITVSATGTGITYELLNSGGTVITTNSTGNFTNLAAASYTVNVIQTGTVSICRYPYPFTITAPTVLGVTASITQQYTCATGSATITAANATGGTAPYQYSINGTTFAAGQVFTGLAAGTYKVTVKDANGCTFQTPNMTVTPPTLVTNITFTATPVTCPAQTSNVTVAVVGGVGPFTYEITAPSTVNNGTTATFNGLAPGAYTFLVTDANGCTFTKGYTINPITPISVVGQNVNNVVCFGAANGALTFTASGFGASFNYTVASTGTVIAPANGATGAINLTNLLAGTYTITVTDPVTTCTATAAVTIQSPTAALAVTKTVTQPTCTAPTGTVVVATTDGWGGNTYALSGAATVGPQTSPTFTGLAAGNYTITVRDANGCTVTDTFTINIVVPPVLTVTGASDLCFDANGASITVAVTAATGTAPFQYSKNGTTFQVSPIFTGLAPGTYTITVRDAKNCTATVTRTINPQLTAVPSLTKGLDCSGSPAAQITVTIGGGATPYSYEVKVGAAAYGASVPLVGSVINYPAASANIYQFRITDATGCVVQTGTTTVTPITPPQFTFGTTTNVLCYAAATGAIQVNINTAFGTAPYTIAVTNTSTSTPYGTQTSGLPAGNYSVTVTDANGCSATSVTSISQPTAAIAYNFLKTDISCNNPGTISYGEITVGNGGGVTGGTAPYTYSVSNNFGDILTPVVSPTGAAHTFTIVNYGIYTITVTDANGCSLTKNNIVIASPPDDLDIIVSSTADCTTGGTVTVEVDAVVGSGTYKFAILTQSSHPFVANPVTDYKGPDNAGVPTIATFTGLIPGVIYTFVVWDTTTGCYFFEEAATAIATNSTINTTSVVPHNVTCFNAGNGNVTFTFGGYSPTTTQVSYEIYKFPSNISTGISDLVNTTGTSTTVNSIPGNLPPGDYIIVFTEIDGTVAGCSQASASFRISQSATLLVPSAVVTKNDNCNLNAGIITGSAQFGTAPYQYQLVLAAGTAPTATTWAGNASPIKTAEGGSYRLYVKDANNCIQSVPIVLPTDASPAVTATLAAQCNTAEGSYAINVARTVNGSLAPFTYSLNGGAFEAKADTFQYTNLTSGVYNIRIKDVNGCIVSIPLDITIYSPLSVTADPTVQPSCTDDDGEVTAAGLGGSASANYLYELRDATAASVVLPQQPSGVFTGLAAGTYTVRLYDTVSTCTVDVAVTLDAAIPVSLTTTTTQQDVSCAGVADGSVTVVLDTTVNIDIPYTYTITGGMPSMPYTLSDPTFTGLVAGNYTITVTSGKGCTLALPVTITEPLPLVATTTATTFACTTGNTINTAVVTVTATIGTGTTPYMYSIDGTNYSTTNTFQIINDGTTTHNIIGYVRDANGCEASEGEVILPLVPLSATAILTTAIECDDNTGVITVTATGGSGNYGFTMLPSGTQLTPGTASQTFAITEPGIYTFEIEDTTTGCITTVSAAEIVEYDVIDVIATAATPVDCFGSATGTITIDVQNYTGAYNYQVFNGATLVTNGTGNTTTNPFTIPNVTAGNLFVTVTATGTPFCSDDTALITVDSPAVALALAISQTASVRCTNDSGEILALATGGWGGYEYELINTTTSTTIQAFGTNNNFAALPAGNYTVNVRDTSGCSTTQSLPLTVPPVISADIDASTTMLLCHGDTTATVFADNLLGGQLTYEYVLNTYDAAGTTIVSSTGPQTSDSFTNLGAGIYSITVTDNWGCGPLITATIEIEEPAQLIGTLSLTKGLTCTTQAEITISATGGTGPYTYSTDNVTYTSTTVYPVGAGTYTYYVKDNNGCAAVLTNAVEILPVPALNLNLDLDAAHINCSGGTNAVITADATGGLGNYQYTLLDSASTPIAGPQASGSFAGLAVGDYYVRVVSGDCNFTSAVITVDEPDPLVVTPDVEDILCFELANGSITINTTGGTGTIQYAISPNLNQFVNTNVFSPLAAGFYDVVVQDQNGCFELLHLEVTKPTEIHATIVNVTDEACLGAADGTINVTISGGTGSYVISTDNITYDPVTGSTHTIEHLPSGLTTVYVKDTNGCSLNPPMSQPILPGVDMDPQAAVTTTCVANAPNNDVTITILTGVDPNNVTYSIDGTNYQSSNVFTNVSLAAGAYTAYARHIKPVTNLTCIQTTAFTIDPHTAIAATAAITQTIDCFGDQGEITINVTAGTGSIPFEYAIGPAFVFGASNVFSGLPTGTYNFKVRDDINCEFDITGVLLDQPSAPLTATETHTHEICISDADGSITITPADGTAPYEVRINGGTYTAPSAAAVTFSNLAPGNYTIDVRDDNGCTYTLPAAITIDAGVDFQEFAEVLPSCNNNVIGNIVFINVNPNIVAGVTYSFDGGPFGPDNFVQDATPGLHNYVMQHTNGCTKAGTFTVPTLLPISASVTATTDINCFGDTTGSITVTATGGTGTLSYAIANSNVLPLVFGPYQPTGVFNGLAFGDYTISIMDDNIVCETQVTATLTQPAAALSATATTVTNEICLGANDGTITITPTDGTSPYEVRINGGAYTAPSATAALFTALAPGSYTVDVRDANGCTYTIPAAITIAPGVDLQASLTSNQVCDVTTIVVSVNPAIAAAITYSLDGGTAQTSNTFVATGLTAGAHTIDVTHSNGCSTPLNFNVAPVIPFDIAGSTTSTTPVLCFGDATGTATFTITGGTAPLTYAISPDVTPRVYGPYQASNTFTGLATGSYVINVKDALGCESESTIIVVGQPAAALSATATFTNEICLSANDGTITVTPANGTAPYEVRINGGAYTAPSATPAVFNALAPGSYTVDVRDANGCTYTIPAAITIAPGVDLQATLTSNQICDVTTVVVSVNPAVAASVTYSLDGGAPQASNTFVVTGLTAGAHTIVVTHSNGCSTTPALNFNVAPVIPFDIAGSTTSTTPVLCFGDATGTATLTITGGTAPLTYAISPDVTPRVYGTYQASNTFAGLATGSYVINVKDALGCESESTIINVGQPAAALSATATFTNEICLSANDGTITVTPANGTAPYEVRINGGAYTSPSATPAVFTALAPGSYTIDVRDANGCTYTIPAAITIAPGVDLQATLTSNQICDVTTVVVSVNPAVAAAITYSLDGGTAQTSNTFVATGLTAGAHTIDVTHSNGCSTPLNFNVAPVIPFDIAGSTTSTTPVLCFGDATGTATFTITGGTAPLTYAISPDVTPRVYGAYQASNIFTGLATGSYVINVKDALGCESESTIIVVGQPAAALSATATFTNEICLSANDGTITVTPTNGTAPYEVRINGGAYTAPSATPAVFNALAPGSYTVDVRDANGCTYTIPAAITIAPGVDLQATLTSNQICDVTTIVVSVNPAVAASVTYSLDGGAPQASNTFVVTGLTAGAHTVVVIHSNGCSTTPALNFNVAPVIPIVMGATSNTPVLCFGGATGTASVTATGGTAPLTYAISPDVTPRVYGTYQASNTFAGLATGSYVINVKDALGCESESTIIVVSQPAAALSATATFTNEICLSANDGTITVTPANGTAPYEVRINGGAYTAPSATPAVFNALAPGSYTVDIRDANGCTYTIPAAITIAPGVDLQATLTSNQVCDVTTIVVSVNPAVAAAVTYSLDGGAPQASNTFVVTGLTAGAHTVVVTHSNGCSTTPALNFNVAPVIPFDIAGSTTSTTPVLCFGDATGTATFTITGGTAPLTYAISPDITPRVYGPYQSSNIFTGLATGSYVINVKDALGCESESTIIVVGQPAAALSATATFTNEICLSANDGTITVTPANGTAPYEVRINGGAYTAPSATPAVFTALAPGSYTIDVRDANGCTYTIPAAITITPGVDLQATLTSNQVCDVTTIVVSVNPAVAASVTYSLDGGAPQASNTFVVTGLTAGAHTVVVTHSNGCSTTPALNFNVAPVIPFDIAGSTTSTTPVLCFGDATGTATFTITGGTAPLTYAISPDVTPRVYGAYQASNIFTGLATGSYVINVKDALGCESESTIINVGQPAAALSATATFTNEICLSANDGTITVTPANGTSPYEVRINGGAYTAPSATPAVFTALAPGSYTVDVRDANGCTYTIPAAITITPGVDLQATLTSNQVCDVTTIVVSVNPAVAAAVTYSLDGGAPQASNTFVVTGLTAGAHTVVVTHSNGCSTTPPLNFNVAPVVPFNIAGSTTSTTPVLCFGDATGTATFTITGGTAPLTYAISPDITPRVYGPYQSSNIFTGLASGSYVINVKDALGCESESTIIVVSQPAAALSATATTVTGETCVGQNDGSITITLTGGTQLYEVSINGGTTYSAPAAGPFVFNNLTPNTYNVIVRDANGCTYTLPATITIAPGVDIQPTVSATQVCDQVTVVVNVNPAVAGQVMYSLDGGTPQASNTFVAVLDPTQQHTVVVTHTSTNCSRSVNVPVSSIIPIQFTASNVITTDVACHGKDVGTITANATGGTPPLQYAITWNIWPNPIYSSANVFTDLLANENPAEGYKVWVKDAMGCVVTVDHILIFEPDAALVITANNIVNESCINAHDGNFSVNITGGTAPYSIALDSAVNFQPYDPAALPTFANLYGRTLPYDVYVRDANGCYAKTTVVIEKGVNLVPGINTVLSCVNNAPVNTVTATLNTIVNNVTYKLETAAGVLIQDFSPVKTWNLAAGDYKYTVRHANGCEKEFPFTVQPRVTINIDLVTPTLTSCNGGNDGTLTVIASGGTGNLTYGISPNFVMTGNNVFAGLTAGDYTVRVEDQYGCFREATNIIVDEPTVIDITLVGVIEEECIDDNNAEIQILISGGTGPYATSLNANGPFVADQDTFTNLDGGTTYTIYAQDANGCIQTFDVPLAAPMDINATAQVVYNCAENTVTIVTDTTINPGELTYSIVAGPKGNFPAQTSNVFENLEDGTYTVEVMHTLKGCTDTANFTIQSVPDLALSLSVTGLNQITAAVMGGAPAYTYTFDGTDVGFKNTFVYYRSGVYEVTVTDSRGCTKVATIEVKFIDIILPDVTTPDGDGQNDTWSPGNTTNYPNINSDIFDRYGRKLATLRQGDAWDGTYEGNAMPTGDYWYLVRLGDAEDRSFVGHFTIYR